MNKEANTLELIAMEIIQHAGDGRHNVLEALDFLAIFDFRNANEKLSVAYTEIKKAHEAQTKAIQAVAGEEIAEEYSILLTHAQDTLMTIYSEYNISLKLTTIVEAMESRIARLEEGNHV